ncbi:hypothetical protein NDI76_19480 [Halogeometricum sp. S1BR25-6]|uniref:Uncharacterized protein n=1 Tax=Halogeometricum salsisoli TaxID=2950536 RepID=A0ABU2GJD1_9EURY|nr:hypothetical protein [Halogeometricum sp. S1BR25-6]MDS0300932.1 hypothetical protein [Halogeometricum sp. S1BR25-6]
MSTGYWDNLVSNQTRRHHFTEPVDVESTMFNTQRYIHRIPVNWLTATDPSYNLDTYEFYLENRDLFSDAVENHRIESVEFEYNQEPVPDGTGKPYRVNLVATTDEKGGAGRKAGEEWKWYSRTHYLLWLLNYDDDICEIIRITPTSERDGLLVFLQEVLPHIPSE